MLSRKTSLLPLAIVASLLAACAAPSGSKNLGAGSVGASTSLRVHPELLGTTGQDVAPGLTMDKAGLRALRSIYFQRESDEVSQEASVILAQHARYINANPGVRLSIQGFADDGKTPAASLALAKQRAEITRNELTNIGVPADRIVAANGKALMLDADEKSWPGNRRAEIIYE